MVAHEGGYYGIDQNDALRDTDPAAWFGDDHHHDPPGGRNASEFPLWDLSSTTLRIIDAVGYALILLGLIVGLVGFFRKNRAVDWSKELK
jgi:hypothetical protein